MSTSIRSLLRQAASDKWSVSKCFKFGSTLAVRSRTRFMLLPSTKRYQLANDALSFCQHEQRQKGCQHFFCSRLVWLFIVSLILWQSLMWILILWFTIHAKDTIFTHSTPSSRHSSQARTNLCPFIYQIPKFRKKLNTLYPNLDQKIPYTWNKKAQDTVYPKPLAGPERYSFNPRMSPESNRNANGT